ATGHYSIAGLATDSYSVQFSDCGGTGYVTQFYNNQSSFSSANPVSVTAGATTANINAAMVLGGTITGTVTDNAATPAPLANICVDAMPSIVGGSGGFAQTDASGSYTIVGLATASYSVQFSDCDNGGYVTQYYNNQPNQSSANLVSVTVGATTANINAAMMQGGSIAGTVTNSAATPVALASICVSARSSSGDTNGFTETDSAGNYSIRGLATGSFTVQFSDCRGTGYLAQYYNNQSSLSTANLVSVTEGVMTGNINVAMSLGGSITGTVTNTAATPVALVGICVIAYPSAGGFSVSAN